MKQKTDVFFDLDHTLWDFEKNSAMAFEVLLDRFHIPCELEDFLNHYVSINQDYWDRYSLNLVSQTELKLGRLRDTFKALDCNIDDGVLNAMSDAYLLELPKNNFLFEGVMELLNYLADRYRLHIVTNGFSVAQSLKIKNSKLDSFFQTVTDSERAGAKKPNPQIFEYAMKQAGTTAKQSVMIGDNWVADIEGALAVGMDAVHFCPIQDTNAQYPYRVAHLLDIKSFL